MGSPRWPSAEEAALVRLRGDNLPYDQIAYRLNAVFENGRTSLGCRVHKCKRSAKMRTKIAATAKESAVVRISTKETEKAEEEEEAEERDAAVTLMKMSMAVPEVVKTFMEMNKRDQVADRRMTVGRILA